MLADAAGLHQQLSQTPTGTKVPVHQLREQQLPQQGCICGRGHCSLRGLWICCRWDEAVGQTEQICTLLFSEAFFNASELDEASDEVRKKHQTGRPEVDAEFLKTKGRKLWDALSKVDLILEQVKQSA
ncbi:unnamed protein product [Durusdinium trenchii]|uniref:Uncharacterized protein n=1 Tax=Durusdinium trenchii TaxID=1381693 RepID=A0ABP0PMB0_9DINO